MTDGETIETRRRMPDSRNVTVSASFSAREIERVDRAAERLGWSRSKLVAECVALALGDPGDGRVRLDELWNPALPGLEKPLEGAGRDEGGPL